MIGWLKGVAEVVCLKMGEKLVKNDFFKDFRQKRNVRDGVVVFQKILVKWWLFQQGFYSCSLQTMWYNASSRRCVDDDRQEDVKIVIQKCGGDGIKFTRFCRCTLNYFQDKVISDRVKSLWRILGERGIRGDSWVWRRKIVSDGADLLRKVFKKDSWEIIRVKSRRKRQRKVFAEHGVEVLKELFTSGAILDLCREVGFLCFVY